MVAKNDMYGRIRHANLALENLRTATFEDVNGLKKGYREKHTSCVPSITINW